MKRVTGIGSLTNVAKASSLRIRLRRNPPHPFATAKRRWGKFNTRHEGKATRAAIVRGFRL